MRVREPDIHVEGNRAVSLNEVQRRLENIAAASRTGSWAPDIERTSTRHVREGIGSKGVHSILRRGDITQMPLPKVSGAIPPATEVVGQGGHVRVKRVGHPSTLVGFRLCEVTENPVPRRELTRHDPGATR